MRTIIFILLIAVSACQSSEAESTSHASNSSALQMLPPDSLPVDDSLETFVVDELPNNRPVKEPVQPPKEMIEEKRVDPFELLNASHVKSPIRFLLVNKDTTIVCPEGTRLVVPADAFVYANGNPVTKPVSLAVTEYYTYTDMLLANLSTASNGRMLETGGMLYLEAAVDGKEVFLANDKSIDIHIPTDEKKEGMQLFIGEAMENGGIDWLPAASSDTSVTGVFDVAEGDTEILSQEQPEVLPTFLTGEAGFKKYISRNVEVPADLLFAGIRGTVYVRFIVHKDGSVSDVNVVNSLHPVLDSLVLAAISASPPWQPGFTAGEPVSAPVTLPISFDLGTEILGRGASNRNKAPGVLVNATQKAAEMQQYVLKTTTLGWINCDRFINTNLQLANYVVGGDFAFDTQVMIVFTEIKAVMRTYYTRQGYQCNNLPLGQPIMIVAMQFDNDTWQLAVQKTRVSLEPFLDLTFHTVSEKDMKKTLSRLLPS